MKKILFTALISLIASKSFSQTRVGFMYSMNLPLSPAGMSVSVSTDKITFLGNWNTGFTGSLYATKSNSGVYALDYPGNRIVGEGNAFQIDRNILTISGGPVIYNNKEKDVRISALAGIGVYNVTVKEQTYYIVHDDMGILDDYLIYKSLDITKSHPTIFTTGILIEKGILSLGAGINTPPAGSGAPIRTNFMFGVNMPMQ